MLDAYPGVKRDNYLVRCRHGGVTRGTETHDNKKPHSTMPSDGFMASLTRRLVGLVQNRPIPAGSTRAARRAAGTEDPPGYII